MSRTPMSPSDLQRIYMLYVAYIQLFHPFFHHNPSEAISCKKKRLTD